jgi:hypothetical protein
MQHLTSAALLSAWEAGLAQRDPRARARVLLALARPDLDDEELGALPCAARDRQLLELRTCAFGTRFEGVAECPQCGATLEMSFDAAELIPKQPAGMAPITELRIDEYMVRFRPPCVDDLDVTDGRPLEVQRAELLKRLVTEAVRAGNACAVAELPAAVLDAVDAALDDAAPPLAEIDLHCDECGGHWNPPFDPAAYLWTELDAWAGRLLWEVHALARAYAWSERDLLSMSPWRRQRYLQMLES